MSVPSPPVFAATLSGGGGLGLGGGSSISPPTAVVGGDYTFHLSSTLELGGAYEHAFLAYTNGAQGALRIYSAIARFHLAGMSGIFVQGKAGFVQRTAGEQSSRLRVGGGVDIGYPIQLSENVDFSPHLGLRYLPKETDASLGPGPSGVMPNLGLLVSFKL